MRETRCKRPVLVYVDGVGTVDGMEKKDTYL